MTTLTEKRRFYRHPVEVPIIITESAQRRTARTRTKNISEGGVCFIADHAIERGTNIQVAIPVKDQVFKINAVVAYSQQDGKTGLFQTGVAFEDQSELFRVKMAEEILSIKKYAEALAKKRGQPISEEKAGRDWVQKYAKRFGEMFQSKKEKH